LEFSIPCWPGKSKGWVGEAGGGGTGYNFSSSPSSQIMNHSTPPKSRKARSMDRIRVGRCMG